MITFEKDEELIALKNESQYIESLNSALEAQRNIAFKNFNLVLAEYVRTFDTFEIKNKFLKFCIKNNKKYTFDESYYTGFVYLNNYFVMKSSSFFSIFLIEDSSKIPPFSWFEKEYKKIYEVYAPENIAEPVIMIFDNDFDYEALYKYCVVRLKNVYEKEIEKKKRSLSNKKYNFDSEDNHEEK